LIESIIILNKILVREFYRLNAGFFLLIITLTFGFMSGVEHKALAEMFVSSWQLLLIPFFVWAIYLIKIINFNSQRLALSENSFVFEFQMLKGRERLSASVTAIINQFVPALAYAVFLTLTAIKNGFYLSVIQLAASVMLLVTLGAVAFLYKINNPHREIRVTFLKQFLDYKFTKTLPQFFIEWVLRREPLLSVGTKVFSCVLIFAVSRLYLAEAYDYRLMSMAAVIVFAANMMIINQLHRFENSYFIQLRSLSFTLIRRMAIVTLVLVLLSIPEFIFLYRFFPGNLIFADYLLMIFHGLSLQLLFYSVMFINLHSEHFSRIIFGIIILTVFLILCKVSLIVLTIVSLAGAILIYRRFYYRFEYDAQEFD
jgi:hypothetical protein